jgi:hypothetical protein
MGAVILNVLEQSIYSTLSGGTALTALLAGTTSFYNAVVPVDAAFDCVVFQLMGGGDENETPRRSKSLVYMLKAISQTSMKTAGLIDAQIDLLFHRKTITATGWTNFWTARETDIAYAETTPEGRNYWHCGGLYRVRLCE